MESEVIGGRVLRNRRSLAAKKETDKENVPEIVRKPFNYDFEFKK